MRLTAALVADFHCRRPYVPWRLEVQVWNRYVQPVLGDWRGLSYHRPYLMFRPDNREAIGL